jgi:hypothetical protein
MSYTPAQVPTSPADVPGYLDRELQSIARAFQLQVPFLQLQTLNVAPTKPREGMVALADGVNWNPGAGAGFYGYRSAAWHLLG